MVDEEVVDYPIAAHHQKDNIVKRYDSYDEAKAKLHYRKKTKKGL